MVQDLVMSQSHEPIKSESAVHTLTEDEDDVYFGSYAHFSIHEDMLKVSNNTRKIKFAGYMPKLKKKTTSLVNSFQFFKIKTRQTHVNSPIASLILHLFYLSSQIAVTG